MYGNYAANPIKFDKTAHQQFDEVGKNAAIKIFSRTKYTLKHNPDIYGVDFLVFEGDVQKFTLEVEVKNFFTTFESLPSFVHVPERKRKFFIVQNSMFLLFNNNCTIGLLIDGTTILQCPVIEKATKRDYGIQDKFFAVNKERFSVCPI